MYVLCDYYFYIHRIKWIGIYFVEIRIKNVSTINLSPDINKNISLFKKGKFHNFMHQTLFYYENIMGFIFSSNNIQGYSLSLRVLLLFIRMRYEVCSLISQCKSKPPQISTLYSKNCNLQPPDPAMISNHFSSVGFLTKLYYNKNSPRLVSSTMTHIYFYFPKKEAARRN